MKTDYEPSWRNEPIWAKPLKTEPDRAPPSKSTWPALNPNFGGGIGGGEASKISGGGKKSYAGGTVPDEIEDY